jgi:transposase
MDGVYKAIIPEKKRGVTPLYQRFTLMRWTSDFKKFGWDAFQADKGRRHVPKLSQQQIQDFQEYVKEHGTTLTSPKFVAEIKDRFRVNVNKSTAHRILKKMNFVYKSETLTT